MTVEEMQEVLESIKQKAGKHGGRITAAQLRQIVEGRDFDPVQMRNVMKFIEQSGITLDASGIAEAEEEKTENHLSPEDEAYVQSYMESLPVYDPDPARIGRLLREMEKDEAAKAELIQRYLRPVAQMAVDHHVPQLSVADLIQEANLAFLMALEAEKPKHKDERWLRERIFTAIRNACAERIDQKDSDDRLVAMVQKLDDTIKELNEDEDGKEGNSFSLQELSILTDMKEEEILDILRLAGEGEENG